MCLFREFDKNANSIGIDTVAMLVILISLATIGVCVFCAAASVAALLFLGAIMVNILADEQQKIINTESFKEMYESDMHRYGPSGASRYCRKFSYYLRKTATCKNKILKLYYRFRFRSICAKHGLEISWQTNIGKGLYVGHPYNITINPKAILGENVNIHKGVTIGQENRGARKGVPTIGNQVWIGINATIVGNVSIGDDVLIAPNSYVNCNVPSHSVVIGNPCKIIPRDNATEHYINNLI